MSLRIKRCPNCGGPARLRRSKQKYYYECDGNCGTQTKKHWSRRGAALEWSSLKPNTEEDTGNAT